MAGSLGRFLASMLLVAALIIAIYIFMELMATAEYSTYLERAIYLGFVGIILVLLFIGIRLDDLTESVSSR